MDDKIKLEDLGVTRKESQALQKLGRLSDADLMEKLREQEAKDDKTPPDDDAAA